MPLTTEQEKLLDSPTGLEAADPGDMLRAVATSAAQVRAGATAAQEAELGRVTDGGRPRAVIVTGMGGSAMAGDVVAAMAGPRCPIPVVVQRGFGLPGWVGAADLVVALSCSGTTEETLSATEEAVRRGARLLGIGAADSPLADLVQRGRGLVIPATKVHSPRATLWGMATPLVAACAALGLVEATPADFEATARRLEDVAVRCAIGSDSFVNPAKGLALDLVDALPMVWGSSAMTGVAAYRFACQWAENVKAPVVSGVLPEAAHNQIVTFGGALAGGAADLFRDRVDDESGGLRLVLLRDAEEHPRVAAQADAARDLAAERGVPVSELLAEGDSAFERLASLIGLIDYTSTYFAILTGIDPSPIAPIDALKAALRARPAGS